jgi:hypothetical protein
MPWMPSRESPYDSNQPITSLSIAEQTREDR